MCAPLSSEKASPEKLEARLLSDIADMYDDVPPAVPFGAEVAGAAEGAEVLPKRLAIEVSVAASTCAEMSYCGWGTGLGGSSRGGRPLLHLLVVGVGASRIGPDGAAGCAA